MPSLTTEQRERIERLCQALESGQYEQVQNTLRKQDIDGAVGYCCLGVGCELYRAEVGGKWVDNEFQTAEPEYDEDGDRVSNTYSDEMLPWDVAQWYGFADSDPEFPATMVNALKPDAEAVGRPSAINCNDEIKLTFPQIAALFRQKYLT